MPANDDDTLGTLFCALFHTDFVKRRYINLKTIIGRIADPIVCYDVLSDMDIKQ